MEINQNDFAINRGTNPNQYVFQYTHLEDIKMGIEGRKMLAEISSERGNHGRYFFKQLMNEEDGREQVEKWKYLKSHGVNVPDLFKPVVMANKSHALVIQDLSEMDVTKFYQ